MRKYLAVLLVVVLGHLTGCASVQMQETPLIAKPSENKAIVNFVRPAIFLGDGISLDIWNGKNYVGALGAGKLIQIEVDPGKHLFLANAENWTYASCDLQAGKQYFIKTNIFPGIVSGRVALATVKSDDTRVPEWLSSLKPITAAEKERKEFGASKQTEIQNAIADFESGKVTSFAKVQFEDGR